MDTYDRIERLMEEYNEKPSDLARSAGLSTGLLSQWKSRMQKPSAAKLAKVAEHYSVTTDYLLNGDKKETNTENGVRKRKLRSVARLESADVSPEMDKHIADYIDFLLSKGDK